MNTSLDPAPPPFDTAPSPGSSFPPPPRPDAAVETGSQPKRKRSAGHIIAIVVGCFLLLPGFGLVLGGGGLAIGQAVATDDDGYFRFTIDSLASDGVAIASDDAWLDADDEEWPWLLDWLDLDVRLRVDGTAATDDVFVGIARTADVERYLSDASYSTVTDIEHRTPTYEQAGGERRSVAPPAEQDFWVASATGDGEQTMSWEARGGRWTIVVMNADGSSDVSADVEIGARSDAITPLAVTLLIVGGVTLLGAIALLVIGVRGRRTGPDGPPPPAPPVGPFVIDDRPSPGV